jgi:hypothetical protein
MRSRSACSRASSSMACRLTAGCLGDGLLLRHGKFGLHGFEFNTLLLLVERLRLLGCAAFDKVGELGFRHLLRKERLKAARTAGTFG